MKTRFLKSENGIPTVHSSLVKLKTHKHTRTHTHTCTHTHARTHAHTH